METRVSKQDILLQVTFPDLQEKFFEYYNSLSYVPELFELISVDKLQEWLIDRFISDFSLKELQEMFEYHE